MNKRVNRSVVFSIFPTTVFIFFSLYVFPQQAGKPIYTLRFLEASESSLIGPDHVGSAGNKNGYEGGVAFHHEGKFHLFVTEEVTGWVQTRTGHWISSDGKKWLREGTVQQPVKDSNNARFSIWSPMPVYNEQEQRWNLFYVGYETNGTIHGRVFRAVSEKPGQGGIGGPYKDREGTVLSFTDSLRNNWEGVQGTDSFYPFRVGNKWMAFYGSSNAASYWYVGLAQADSLEGKWRRIIAPPTFKNAENPIVTRLTDGTLFAVYDNLNQLSADSSIGYAWSKDGIRWQSSVLSFPLPSFITNIRTPQSLIPAGNNEYWIYFTGNTNSGFDVVGRIKVRLEKVKK